MDFLLARDFPIARIADSLRAAAIGWVGATCHTSDYGPISVFATDPMGLNPLPPQGTSPAHRERFYLFDGQFSAGTSYFHPLLPQTAHGLPKRIDDLVERNSAVEAVNAGVFVAGRIDHNSLTLVTDPLGQYPLYYFQSGERFLISNVMRYLTIAMTASGITATPSLLPCLESMMLGGSLGNATHIREIRRLPHAHYIHANPNLHFRPSMGTEYPASYEALIAGTHDALMRHVVAVSASAREPRYIVTDVTGGADSRLMLSLMMASPMRDEFRGRCHVRYPHPDANAAGALFARYNLRVAQMPLVVDTDRRSWAEGLTQRSIDGNAGFMGGTHVAAAPFWTIAFPNLVHFGGCFGEIGGASPGTPLFESPADLGVTIENAVDQLIRRTRKARSLGLFTEAAQSLVRDDAIAAIRALEDEGIPREQIQAEFYLRTRCRNHFGLRNWLENKHKVLPDPLASPWLVAARRALPWRLHSKNKVIFDLLLAGGWEDLAKMPLANEGWDIEIVPVQEREEYRSIAAVDASTPELSPQFHVLQKQVPVFSTPVRRRTKDNMAGIKAKATAAQSLPSVPSPTGFAKGRYVGSYRAMLHDLVDRVPVQHDLWSLIDRDAVAHWGRKDGAEFTSKSTAVVGRVLSGIRWYLDQPQPAGVQELKDFDP